MDSSTQEPLASLNTPYSMSEGILLLNFKKWPVSCKVFIRSKKRAFYFRKPFIFGVPPKQKRLFFNYF
ncbi:MAG: hypothetical protein EBU33_02985 [Sphingobacteriia bacterium]|nr:hypothetical protein [Sphingobacteriia bacterium]